MNADEADQSRSEQICVWGNFLWSGFHDFFDCGLHCTQLERFCCETTIDLCITHDRVAQQDHRQQHDWHDLDHDFDLTDMF